MKFVTLKSLVLRLSLQPHKGASSYIHDLRWQEAVSAKIINPERRVLNMYNALVVIPKATLPQRREKEGSLWRLFCLWQETFSASSRRSSQLQNLTLVCPSFPLLPAFAVSVCLQWNHFQTLFSGLPFFWVHIRCHGKVDPTTLVNKTLLSVHFLITGCLIWSLLKFPSVLQKSLISIP